MPRRSLAAFDLKAARKMRGLSQIQTATILCTTQPSVARWEADGNMPEAFRKLWALHWQQEDKANDAGSNKRSRKSSKSKRPPRRSDEGTRSSVERLSESEAGSEEQGSFDSAG